MSSERTYYVFCEDNCKFESMTKEQILTAISQALSTGKIDDIDSGFVTKIKEVNKNNPLMFWVGTTAEFNALEDQDENTFYIVTDATEGEDLSAEINDINTKIKNTVDIYKKVLWKATDEDVISTETINFEDPTTWRTIEGLSDYTIFVIQAVLGGAMIGVRQPSGNLIQAYSILPGWQDNVADNETAAVKLWIDIEHNNPNTICKVEGKYAFRNGARLGRITGII